MSQSRGAGEFGRHPLGGGGRTDARSWRPFFPHAPDSESRHGAGAAVGPTPRGRCPSPLGGHVALCCTGTLGRSRSGGGGLTPCPEVDALLLEGGQPHRAVQVPRPSPVGPGVHLPRRPTPLIYVSARITRSARCPKAGGQGNSVGTHWGGGGRTDAPRSLPFSSRGACCTLLHGGTWGVAGTPTPRGRCPSPGRGQVATPCLAAGVQGDPVGPDRGVAGRPMPGGRGPSTPLPLIRSLHSARGPRSDRCAEALALLFEGGTLHSAAHGARGPSRPATCPPYVCFGTCHQVTLMSRSRVTRWGPTGGWPAVAGWGRGMCGCLKLPATCAFNAGPLAYKKHWNSCKVSCNSEQKSESSCYAEGLPVYLSTTTIGQICLFPFMCIVKYSIAQLYY